MRLTDRRGRWPPPPAREGGAALLRDRVTPDHIDLIGSAAEAVLDGLGPTGGE